MSNATDVEQYINALHWALKNRKLRNIRNVALTGTYGSGKSSILKTFQQTTIGITMLITGMLMLFRPDAFFEALGVGAPQGRLAESL